MECPSCGGQNFDGAEFCSMCLRSFKDLDAEAGPASATWEPAADQEEWESAGRAAWEINPAAVHETPAMSVDHERVRAQATSGRAPVHAVSRPPIREDIPGTSESGSVLIRYLLAGLLLMIGIGVWVLFIR